MENNYENVQKKLMCVLYPGLVKNEENMLKTLGGINRISEIFTHSKRRMELKFRPDNIFAKPTLGDRTGSTGILLKVKVRRKKNSKTDEAPKCSVEILGHVDSVYRFESLCDFQYLPLEKEKETGEIRFIYNEVVPQDPTNTKWIKENTNVPYFLPPGSFARIDSIHNSIFKREYVVNKLGGPSPQFPGDECIERKTRRNKYLKVILFSLHVPIPDEPPIPTPDYFKTKFITEDLLQKVKAMFEKRPIWSKMSIAWESHISNDQLKCILPIVSYYYSGGPWRVMWIRYGYDPRKHFESRYYQTFDYRVKNSIAIKVNLKRNESLVKKLYINSKSTGTKILDASQIADLDQETGRQKRLYNPYYEYGQLPESKQTVYQYCDVHVPKIQEMLDKIPSPMSGAVCNEKTGWLPPGFDEQCRDIINEGVRETTMRMAANKEEDGDGFDQDDDIDGDEYGDYGSDQDEDDADLNEDEDDENYE